MRQTGRKVNQELKRERRRMQRRERWERWRHSQKTDRGGSLKERLRIGTILAALVASVAVFAVMLQTEKRVLAEYEKGTIFTAAKAIPRGTVITEKNRSVYFEERELDRRSIPPTALSDPVQTQGLAAVYDIDGGTLLTGGMFEARKEILEGMEEPCVIGFRAEDLYQVVGGVLRAGDRIHIYSVSEEQETELIRENVYVQAVFDQSGKQIANEDTTTAAQRINVYLDRADIPEFYTELSLGSIRVVQKAD